VDVLARRPGRCSDAYLSARGLIHIAKVREQGNSPRVNKQAGRDAEAEPLSERSESGPAAHPQHSVASAPLWCDRGVGFGRRNFCPRMPVNRREFVSMVSGLPHCPCYADLRAPYDPERKRILT